LKPKEEVKKSEEEAKPRRGRRARSRRGIDKTPAKPAPVRRIGRREFVAESSDSDY
jgi:hypothetical protein